MMCFKVQKVKDVDHQLTKFDHRMRECLSESQILGWQVIVNGKSGGYLHTHGGCVHKVDVWRTRNDRRGWDKCARERCAVAYRPATTLEARFDRRRRSSLLSAVVRNVVNSCDFTIPPGLKASSNVAHQQLHRQIKQPRPNSRISCSDWLRRWRLEGRDGHGWPSSFCVMPFRLGSLSHSWLLWRRTVRHRIDVVSTSSWCILRILLSMRYCFVLIECRQSLRHVYAALPRNFVLDTASSSCLTNT